jgi:hypothetical protein
LARKAAVDMFAIWVGKLNANNKYVSTIQNFPPDFILDLLRAALIKRPVGNQNIPLDSSKYVETKTGTPT